MLFGAVEYFLLLTPSLGTEVGVYELSDYGLSDYELGLVSFAQTC
jgi:hypothetical protein